MEDKRIIAKSLPPSLRLLLVMATGLLSSLCFPTLPPTIASEPKNSPNIDENGNVMTPKARKTFLEFRRLEQNNDLKNIIKLYSTNATIVFIDTKERELKLTPEDLSKISKYFGNRAPIGEEDNILYDWLKITPSNNADSYTITGVRENRTTKRAAPFYLKINGESISHHAYEPIYEVDTQLLANQKDMPKTLLDKIQQFDFKDLDKTPLPSITIPSSSSTVSDIANTTTDTTTETTTETTSVPTYAENSTERVLNKTEGSETTKALRIRSKESLATIGTKFKKYLEKEFKDSSFSIIAQFNPTLSGSTIDPRNIYNMILIRTDALKGGIKGLEGKEDDETNTPKNPENPRVEVWLLGVQLLRTSLDSDKVIITYKSSQLPQNSEGAVPGKEINTQADNLIKDLNSIDTQGLQF